MTLVIIIITAIVSVLSFSDRKLMDKLQFNPYRVRHNNEIHRFITYGFVHADWVHLAVNLYVLYSFGEAVEMYYKELFTEKAGFYFTLLYLGGILFSTLASYLKQKENPYYNAVGASGAISGIVFASILFNPAGRMGMMFLPFSFPAIIFGILYLVYSAYMAKRSNDNIGHDAHFWGAIFGLLFTLALEPNLGIRFIHHVSSLTGY